MGYQKYILIILLSGLTWLAHAQEKPFARADSLTDSLLSAGNWKEALAKGKQYIANGTDYAGLRLKVGFAEFMNGNYAAAIKDYNRVLRDDPHSQTACYYLYLCYKYMNNQALAGEQLANLDSTSLKLLHVNRSDVTSAGLESSYKIANTTYRGNASYTKFDLSGYIAGKLQVYDAASYFGQYIYDYVYDFKLRRHQWEQYDDQQKENFLKLSYPLFDHFTLTGGWHYLYTLYQTTNYKGNLFVGGINYNAAYFNLQADMDAGRLMTDKLKQYNGQLMVNPLGNLDLYFISGVSYLNRNTTDNFVFSETAGFKAAKNVWLETSATFGNQDDYVEAGGLYIYNTFDDTRLKMAETAYIQLSKKLQLDLSYTYEKKRDDVQKFYYSQNSIAAGILWKF